MTQLLVGMHCVYDGTIGRSPERIDRLATLLADRRWHYQFKRVHYGYLPAAPTDLTSPGQVAKARLETTIRAGLASSDVGNVTVSVSVRESANQAYVHVELGRGALAATWMQHANAIWRVPTDGDVEATVARWVELQHEIVATLGIAHGVLITATNRFVMSAETWLSVPFLDGQAMHRNPAEIRGYGVNRADLGRERIRKPRWGTYLKPAHVAAIGGRAHLLEIVKPPVVRDVGELLYVQLSERIADATAEATKMRYRAFVELLAPITMPPHEA